MRAGNKALSIIMFGGSKGPIADYLFDQGSLSTFTVVDSAAPTIRITPRTWTITGFANFWYWYGAKSKRWAGRTPHFLIAKASFHVTVDAAFHLAMWATSADSDTWNDFDNVTIGASDIEFYNNAPFPAGTIYIALTPMYPYSRTQRKITEWAADAYVGETASSTDYVIGSTTARATVDTRTAPVLPIYAFKISKGGPNTKNIAVLATGQHPGETAGRYAFEGAIDWLLGGSDEAEFLLDWFDFYVYPQVNPQGAWAGYSRSSPQVPGTDHNGMWFTTGTCEEIDLIKTAMTADTGGAIAAGFDFHGYADDITALGDVPDATNAFAVAFRDAYKTHEAAFTLLQEVFNLTLHELWIASYGASLAMSFEQGLDKTRTITQYKNSGQYAMQALRALQSQGRFTNGPGVGSRDFNGTTNRIDWASPWTPSGAMSFSFWMACDTLNDVGLLCVEKAGGGYNGLYIWMSNSSGALTFAAEGGTDLLQTSANSVVPADGTWHNYVVTWDGVVNPATGAHIYKDGLEVAYAATTNGASPATYSGRWSLGGFYAMDNYNLDGRMAQTGAWSRVLTPTEISNLAAGYSPDLAAASGLVFYFAGNTASLTAVPGGLGVADGTSQLTGIGNGPSIIYP